MAEEKQCVLVIVGADEYGRKELLAMTDGFRESTQSWREVLLGLKSRGLNAPKLAVGDPASEGPIRKPFRQEQEGGIDNPMDGAIIVVAQRPHEDDLAGRLGARSRPVIKMERTEV